MADLDELDDLTTTDTGMPSPEMATMSREEFDAGAEPEFAPIGSEETGDEVAEEAVDSGVEAFYAWYNMEKYSAYFYRYLSAKANLMGLTGAEEFFQKKYDEESEHADTVLEYILMRFDHDDPIFYPIDEPPELGSGNDIVGVFVSMFQTSLEHERKVTALISDLKAGAEERGEYQDSAFINSFLTEQVEEEDEFRTIIQRATLAGNEGSVISLEHELLGSVAMKDND
jgi:ferritin